MAKSLNWQRQNSRALMRQHGAVSIADEREEELRRSLPQHRPRRWRERPSKADLRAQAEAAYSQWLVRPSKPRPSGLLPWEDER
jgi:hypothetical protein